MLVGASTISKSSPVAIDISLIPNFNVEGADPMDDDTLEPRRLRFDHIATPSPSILGMTQFMPGPLRQPGDPMPFDLYDAVRIDRLLETRLSLYTNNILMLLRPLFSPLSS